MNIKAFIRMFSLFTIIFLIPLLLFFGITDSLTKKQMRETAEVNNLRYLQQVQVNTELVLDQLDQMSLSYDSNTLIGYLLDMGLRQNRALSYANQKSLLTVRTLASTELQSRPYIHSMYVYFDYFADNFFSSTAASSGVVSVHESSDQSWLESYFQHSPDDRSWSEIRTIQESSFASPATVLSLFQLTDSRKGVIVLNLHPHLMENELESVSSNQEVPCVFILNENDDIVMQIGNLSLPDDFDFSFIHNDSSFTVSTEWKNEDYYITHFSSEENGWSYLAVIPDAMLTALQDQLAETFIFVLLLCVVLALGLSLSLTFRNYRHMNYISQLLDAAKAGQPLPKLPSRSQPNEYTFLTEKLIRTFVKHQYLQIASSEKMFRMKTMDLQTLQAQLNPHFLFNTLQTIYWKSCALTNEPNDVSYMIDALSGILRYALENPHSAATIAEELTQTRNYLAIQTKRFPEKFDVKISCSDDLLDKKVLRLILQPIVENSIQHGILKTDRKGLVSIQIKQVDNSLKIKVHDNGMGMSKDTLEQLRQNMYSTLTPEESFPHIGFLNTVRRIYLKYGDAGTVQVHSKLHHGTTVILNIPLENEAASESTTTTPAAASASLGKNSSHRKNGGSQQPHQ